MADQGTLRVLASGATKLWTAGVRQGPTAGSISDKALEAERPFHLAALDAEQTLCGLPVSTMSAHSIEFSSLARSARCSICDHSAQIV